MTRQHAAHVPAHTHLRDATSHLANARRSLEAAGDRVELHPELARIVRHLELYVRRLGRAAARAERGPVA